MTPERGSKDGVVLTGGGAKGAYEVGVLKALLSGHSPASGHQPVEVEVFSGTSVGAYNAAFLASQNDVNAAQAAGRLETVWRERIANGLWNCGNGVFRLRDSPLNLRDPGCFIRPLEVLKDTVKDATYWASYAATRGAQFLTAPPGTSIEFRALESVNLESFFDPAPLYQLIEETLDRERLAASNKALTVPATDWLAGKLRLFSKAELAGSVGPRGIAASTAIPGILPPIVIDDVPYHDGGVLQNTPLKPAIEKGAEVIHVIYLDPEVCDIPLSEPPDTISTVYRMFLITSAALMRRDITYAMAIQRELELHRDLGLISPDFLEVLADVGSNSRVLRRLRRGRPYRPLTIHRYRPTNDLGGGIGLLDFSLEFVDQLILEGYNDAVAHDCRASGCLLPEGAVDV